MAPPPWPSATRLATHWVADHFAGDESTNISVLQALVNAPSEHLAGAPEATRERVALRCLQQVSSLVPAAAGGDADAAASAGLLSVDGARSGEDVLFRLIREVEIFGTLEKDLLPPYNQDIKQTIVTKKLALPETSFQLLQGVDPCIKSMIPQSQLEHNSLILQFANVLLSKGRNGAHQVSKSATNLQPGTATEGRMAFEEQNTDKSHLEVSGANKANQALHDDGSTMKNNMVHGGLTGQNATVSEKCNITLHDKTTEANCFSEQKNERNRTDVQKDNCHTSIPSSSKDRDGESAKKTSDEEKSEDTSPEICVCSMDQYIDDILKGLSQDLCAKCGKDGELLKCSDCPLAVHARCFSSMVTIEETNLFYCPACRYREARESCEMAWTEYDEAKKNATAYDEQLNGVQPGAASRDDYSNGCDTSERTHENENGERSSPLWRNMRDSKKRLHEKEPAVPSKKVSCTRKKL